MAKLIESRCVVACHFSQLARSFCSGATYPLVIFLFCIASSLEVNSTSSQKDGFHENRTLILCAATHNTSWTEAVTENHILWMQRMTSADYRYVEDPRFGLEEINWDSSHYPIGSEVSNPSKSIPRENSRRLQPHWLKIHLLQEFMAREADADAANYSHILWVDDDILFTSRVDLLKSLYARMDKDTHLIIAKDVGNIVTTTTTTILYDFEGNSHVKHAFHKVAQWNQVNTGFMFFRISQNSRALLQSVWEQRLSHLGFCENQSCLHEQDALNNLLDPRKVFHDDTAEKSRVGKAAKSKNQSTRPPDAERASTDPRPIHKMVKVLEPYNPIEPTLNLNTVWRLTHMWKGEFQPKNYRGDPLHTRWHWGDNMAHVSGMTRSCRQEMLLWLAKYVKQQVFFDGDKPQYDHSIENNVVVFSSDYMISPSWHPLAITQCSREALPIGGGNWILPRRTAFDLDALLVAHTQGSLESSVDPTRFSTISFLDQHEFQQTGAGMSTGATYLWQLLPVAQKRLPYLDAHLLLQLTDATGTGMERYWNLVLYSVQVSQQFADVDPDAINHFSSFNAQSKWCGAQPHLSDDNIATSLQAHGSFLDSSLVGNLKQTMSCSPYALLSLAAIAQNPDVFMWVSLVGLSFIEYHSIALEAVLRRPEQLANVDPMIYLDLGEGNKGGLAYYDLAMKAVCLEGGALQYVQKVSILDDLHEKHTTQGSANRDFAPLLLPPPSWAKGSFPLVVAPGRRTRGNDKSNRGSESGVSYVWPWDIIDTSEKVGNYKHPDKRRNYFSLARAAVHQDGFALKFVSVEELSTKEYFILAKTAVAQNGQAFSFVNASAIGGAMSETYYEIALKAVHSRGEAFWEIDTAFLSDVELIVLVLKAIHNGDPAAFKAFNAREAIKQRKGTYTELALLALSGAGAESFRGAALNSISAVTSIRPKGGSARLSTVDVLEFIDSGRLIGAKARHAMAEAVLRQDRSEEVWEQVEELFRQGMRKDDYEDLLERFGKE